MKNILNSCFDKTKDDATVINDWLTILLTEDDNYKKNREMPINTILKDKEVEYIKYLQKIYQGIGSFPSKQIFIQNFPETQTSLTVSTTESPLILIATNDFNVYVFQFIDARINQFISARIANLNKKIAVEGVTEEIQEQLDLCKKYSNRNQANKQIDIKINGKSNYQALKERPMGLQTGVKAIDSRIGGMNEGTLNVIAGFTSQFKCVSENERVLTSKGLLTMKEIYNEGANSGLLVQSEYGMKPLVAVHDEGVKDSYIISIGGVPIETSPVHRFRVLTDDGIIWVEAQNLKVGDKVLQSLKESYHNGEEDDPDFWRFYGQLCGDGGVTCRDVYLCGTAENLVHMESGRLFRKFFSVRHNVTIEKPKKEGYLVQANLRAPILYTKRCELYNFANKNAKTKEFPKELYYKTRNCWKAFILGLYETDGCSGDNLGFTMSNKPFLLGVSRLLAAMGISSTIIYTGKSNDSYHLRIAGGRSKNRFSDIVKSVNFKASNIKNFNVVNDNSTYFPTRSEFLKYKVEGKSYNYSKLGSFHHRDDKKRSNYHTIERVCEDNPEFKKSEYFSEILNAELSWNTVTSIETSKCYMYDLTVEGSPTYLLNGYVTHNTTFALNIAHLNSQMYGYNIVYITLETPKNDMYWNLLSCHSFLSKFQKYRFIGHDKMRQAILNAEEEDYLFGTVEPELYAPITNDDGTQTTKGSVIFLDESDFDSFSFGEIQSVLQKIDEQVPIDALFVDYIQLCKFNGTGVTDNETSQVNAYVSFFRRLSQNFKKVQDPITGEFKTKQLTVLLLSQIRRDSWRKAVNHNGVYDVTCMSDSSELEKSAYRIFTTYTTEDMKAQSRAQVQILKNRTGQTMQAEPAEVYANGEAYVFCDEDGMDTNTFANTDATATLSAAFDGIGGALESLLNV